MAAAGFPELDGVAAAASAWSSRRRVDRSTLLGQVEPCRPWTAARAARLGGAAGEASSRSCRAWTSRSAASLAVPWLRPMSARGRRSPSPQSGGLRSGRPECLHDEIGPA